MQRKSSAGLGLNDLRPDAIDERHELGARRKAVAAASSRSLISVSKTSISSPAWNRRARRDGVQPSRPSVNPQPDPRAALAA
jgi:hypothetical protein